MLQSYQIQMFLFAFLCVFCLLLPLGVFVCLGFFVCLICSYFLLSSLFLLLPKKPALRPPGYLIALVEMLGDCKNNAVQHYFQWPNFVSGLVHLTPLNLLLQAKKSVKITTYSIFLCPSSHIT